MSLFSIFTGKFPSVVRNYNGYQRRGYEYIDMIQNLQYETIADYLPNYKTFSWIESKAQFDNFRSYLGNRAISGFADKELVCEYTEYIRDATIHELQYIDEYLDEPREKNILYFHFFPLHFCFNKTYYDFRISCLNQYLGIILNKFPIHLNDYIIFGDHGDATGYFNEEVGHVFPIIDEVLKVPLIMIINGMKHRNIHHKVSLMDIIPTVLKYKNKNFKVNSIDLIHGIDLQNLIENNKYETRDIYSRNLFPNQTLKNFRPKLSCIRRDKKVIIENTIDDEYIVKYKKNNIIINSDREFEDMSTNLINIDKFYKKLIKNIYGNSIIDMWDNKKYTNINIHNDKKKSLFNFNDFNCLDNVLILGCGANQINIEIAKKVCNTVMVDWQKSVFDFYDYVPNTNFVVQKAEDYINNTNKKEYFDVILLDMVVHHFAYYIEDILNYDTIINILSNCKKLLKPNGKIIIGEGILPANNNEVRKFYNKVFAFKEIRHIFGDDDLNNILISSGYKNIKKQINTIEMSINNWLENNILCNELKQYIYNLHNYAPFNIKRAYNMRKTNNDILIDSKFMYIMGQI